MTGNIYQEAAQMKLEKVKFGTMPDGGSVEKIKIQNSSGISAEIITYGCTIITLRMPDREGKTVDIVLGFDTLEEYFTKSPFFGAIVGRFANRISRGKFTLDGKEYSLACNDSYGAGEDQVMNHLHGGDRGYDKIVWRAETFEKDDSAGVKFTYLSPDGEEGYPGNLDITALYILNEDNELIFDYYAKTDKPTPVNLTNHSYWNLAGAGSGNINNHELMLNCPAYLPIDSSLMPTGEIKAVTGSAMDFTAPKKIGKDLDGVPGGYDHCFTAGESALKINLIARVYEPDSGRGMDVITTKPAVQFYGGNFLDGIKGAGGAVFEKHGAFCLETEHYPDAVNQPSFPSCILRPDGVYHHRTVHRFFIRY
jgi:aldose 1-epimerase